MTESIPSADPAAVAARGLDGRRRRFPRSPPGAPLLLRLLTAQDGSTTRLCEALTGAPVQVSVLRQGLAQQLPAPVRGLLGGGPGIERIASLSAAGEVLTDNLVYVALDGLDAGLRGQLEAGCRPIGHLMAGRWLRREAVAVGDEVLARLWDAVGAPDPGAMRCYRLRSPDGLAMLICEVFRHGLWRLAQAAPGGAPG